MTENPKPLIKTGAPIGALVPADLDQAYRMAQAISQSGLAPQGMSKPEQILIAIMHGMEIGLPPMQAVQKIAVVNGRPAIWGDAIPSLLWSKGFRLEEELGDDCATCTVIRPTGEKITRTFSKQDAQQAGLWGRNGPWKQYPRRMLQMRARSLAARDGAADALSGLYLAEEAQDIGPPEMRDITPAVEVSARDGNPDAPIRKGNRPSSKTAEETGGMEQFQALEAQVKAASTVAELQAIYDDHERDGQPWAMFPTGWAKLIQLAYHYALKDAMASAPEDVSQDTEDDTTIVDVDGLLNEMADAMNLADGNDVAIAEVVDQFEHLIPRLPKKAQAVAMQILRIEDVQESLL